MSILNPKQISTQEHLDIEDIRDDLVILKNASVALVLETNALNFELLAESEKDANIYTFANLLNALNFPIQIVIRTVATDISKYVDQLSSYQTTVANTPLSGQIDIYKDFISNLTQNTNILDKSFYVVIPTKAFEAVKTSAIRELFGQKQRLVNVLSIIDQAKGELYPKRDAMIKQFANMGLQAWQLKNDELIKLYYGIYDPDKTGGSKLGISETDITKGIVNMDMGEATDLSQIKQEL